MGVHDTHKYPMIKHALGIPEDEPIFILRAQDSLSLFTLEAYADECEGSVSHDFISNLNQLRDEFRDWQAAHPSQVKTPD